MKRRCQVPATSDVALQAGRSTKPRALRVGFWWSARLVKGAARVWMCLRRGAAVSGSARLGAARGGAGTLPASGWRVCTGCSGARAAGPALGSLAPGGGGLGAAGAGLMPPWEAFVRRRGAGAAFASELPYPARRAPRRLQAVCAASARCGAHLGVPAARRGGFGVGATRRGAGRGKHTSGVRIGSCDVCVVELAVGVTRARHVGEGPLQLSVSERRATTLRQQGTTSEACCAKAQSCYTGQCLLPPTGCSCRPHAVCVAFFNAYGHQDCGFPTGLDFVGLRWFCFSFILQCKWQRYAH